ncbi:MAG: hypothetical protein K2O70_05075 [Desulfovibrionaceae bacterium]|nr:hypothetical protein [Desulfovibrionaceae bacterium]
MNIRTEQLDALYRQQGLSTPRPAAEKGESFAETLAQQMGISTENIYPQGSVPPPGAQVGVIGEMLIGNTENISGEATVETVLRQTSGALDMWDSYADALGDSGTADLRQAYSLLQGLDSQLVTLRQSAQSVLGQNPELADIVNDLEVMTATEKFKFNRGDYI